MAAWCSNKPYQTPIAAMFCQQATLHIGACRVVAKDELDNMLANPQLGRRVPLLFLANKMDLPSALTPVELAQVRPAVDQLVCKLAAVVTIGVYRPKL
jgi:hypothetical protein